MHLEWDGQEQRAALLITSDTEPVAGLERLDVRPLHLVGGTVLEAARRTVRAVPSDTVLATSSGSELDGAASLLAGRSRFWVRGADRLTSPQVAFVDAARAWGVLWGPCGLPSSRTRSRAPLLWLAMPANA
ncbi:hypothetical protein GCM10010433_62060 [Streptomyces pulveraceus]